MNNPWRARLLPRVGVVRPRWLALALPSLVAALLIRRAWRARDRAMLSQSVAESQSRQLMAAISRELRAPLCALQAMLEAMADGVVTDAATLRRYQGDARMQARRLTALVDELLARAQMELMDSAGTVPQRERTDLGDLATRALDAVRGHAQRMGVSLALHIDGPAPLAFVDAEQVGRILDRLLRNAIRHTPAGGAVVMHVETHPAAHGEREALFQVIDTGDGIPASRLRSLFAAPRPASADPLASGATGFGLSLAARVAQAHGGRMWAESPLPANARALIALTVPAARAAPREPDHQPDGPDVVGAVVSFTLPVA